MYVGRCVGFYVSLFFFTTNTRVPRLRTNIVRVEEEREVRTRIVNIYVERYKQWVQTRIVNINVERYEPES